jgi:hypothetical protein
VLQEVCGSIRSFGLSAASSVDENPDSSGLRIWRVLGSDLHHPPSAAQSFRAQSTKFHTVNPLVRVVASVMLWLRTGEVAGDANDRVKVEGNFLGRTFRRNDEVKAFLATRAAAIVTTAEYDGRREGASKFETGVRRRYGKMRKQPMSECARRSRARRICEHHRN